MSRAFVKEDDFEPEPDFRLPDPDSPYFDEAAAVAFLKAANAGNTKAAEDATGYRWGEPRLVEHMEALVRQAEEADDLRQAQLARRFLRAAKKRPS